MKSYEKKLMVYLSEECMSVVDSVASRYQMKKSNAIRFIIHEYKNFIQKNE